MQIGLKLFPQVEEKYVDKLAALVDFIEIFAKPEAEYSFVTKYGLPVIVHASHSEFGTNFCNPDKAETNEKFLNWAKTLADRFNSSKIIIHPEFIENDRCTTEYLCNFIKKHYDPRFLIESMPFAYGELKYQFLCYGPDQIKNVMQKCSIGFCLDLNHSSHSAYGQNIPLETLLKSLIELGPKHFHISDADLTKGNAKHLNLFDGNMDLKLIKSLLPANAQITVETPSGNLEKQKKEIEFLRSE